ncbi:hypothetical protein LXL04_007372 [Taraxacum kok-saghyz]
MIHSKFINPEVFDSWQNDIILTLCQLEMYFPPSIFDVMVHLISHIVNEIKCCGPVFQRYMYPFERHMGIFKGYVRNRYRQEESIIEGYVTEKVIEYCTDYLHDVSRSESYYGGVTVIASTELSGDTVDARSRIAKESYYDVIQEISELKYDSIVISMFKCKWVDNQKGVKVDNDGFTIVDLSTNGYVSEPFILAKQATHVCYVEDPKDSRKHIIMHNKRYIIGVDNVVDEEEYDQFDELPLFPFGITSSNDDVDDTTYLRSDHNEGGLFSPTVPPRANNSIDFEGIHDLKVSSRIRAPPPISFWILILRHVRRLLLALLILIHLFLLIQDCCSRCGSLIQQMVILVC